MFKTKLILVVLISTLLLSQSSWAQAHVEVEGELDVKSNKITNVQDPVNAQDAATKAYVDTLALSLRTLLGLKTVQELLNDGQTPAQIIADGADTTDFIGLNYAGGIIFYARPDGTGLISASTDQSNGTMWGCTGIFSLADGRAIGTGSANTLSITTVCTMPDLGDAADICVNLTLNGYNDWFLPAQDELNEMYMKIGPGASGFNQNIGGFATAMYWSSSEEWNNKAFAQDFTDGMQSALFKTGQPALLHVRAIRAF